MYIQLYQAKKHMNIDNDFHDDDEYIVDLCAVAEKVVETHIDKKLKDICCENGGELPPPLLHAMLLLIGNFYANRESVAFASSAEIPLSYKYLIDLYQCYGKVEDNNNKCQCK